MGGLGCQAFLIGNPSSSFRGNIQIKRNKGRPTTDSLATSTDLPMEQFHDDEYYDNEYFSNSAMRQEALLDGQIILNDIQVDTTSNISGNLAAVPDAVLAWNPRVYSPMNNVSYFYLQNEVGLSERAMWRITFEAGSALGMTAQTIRSKVEMLKNATNMTDSDLCTLLERQPTLLHLSAKNNIAPTLDFLIETLQLDKAMLRRLLLASPSILTYRQSNLLSKIRFFTNELGFSVHDLRYVILLEPRLLRCSVRSGLQPRKRFYTRDLAISIPELRELVRMHPAILLYSVQRTLVPKLIFFFILTLHYEPTEVLKYIRKFPKFLDYSLEDHILPIARYFLHDLEYSPAEVKKMLFKFPRLFTNSLAKMKRTVGYLRYENAMTADQVKRVLFRAPQVLSLRVEQLNARMTFLKEVLGTNEIQPIVAGMPTILALSVSLNLQPKCQYLRTAFRYDSDAFRLAMERLPTLLGYSLSNRIRPRMEAILDANLDPSSITVGIPMKQDVFEKWVRTTAMKRREQQSQQMIIQKSSSPSASIGTYSPKVERVLHWTRERRQLEPRGDYDRAR